MHSWLPQNISISKHLFKKINQTQNILSSTNENFGKNTNGTLALLRIMTIFSKNNHKNASL